MTDLNEQLRSRIEEARDIVRAGSRWNGNEQEFATKGESDVAMLDDLLTDIARLARSPASPAKVDFEQKEITAAFDAHNECYEFPSEALRGGALNQWTWGWWAGARAERAKSVVAASPAVQPPAVNLAWHLMAAANYIDKLGGVSQSYRAALVLTEAQPITDELRTEIEKLTKWKLCMSYNDSYFGEPAGLVKRVAMQLDRLLDRAPAAEEPVAYSLTFERGGLVVNSETIFATREQAQHHADGFMLPRPVVTPLYAGQPPAQPALQADAGADLYACIGKGGTYRLIGYSNGAGTKRGETIAVYESVKDSNTLYHRTVSDFEERMVALDTLPVALTSADEVKP